VFVSLVINGGGKETSETNTKKKSPKFSHYEEKGFEIAIFIL
jgi:hypothetical protein